MQQTFTLTSYASDIQVSHTAAIQVDFICSRQSSWLHIQQLFKLTSYTAAIQVNFIYTAVIQVDFICSRHSRWLHMQQTFKFHRQQLFKLTSYAADNQVDFIYSSYSSWLKLNLVIKNLKTWVDYGIIRIQAWIRFALKQAKTKIYAFNHSKLIKKKFLRRNNYNS